MEYYLALKRNKVLVPATTWKNFKNIMKETDHMHGCMTAFV
jgi:aspartate/tyrosine/aromatic aminotransferase